MTLSYTSFLFVVLCVILFYCVRRSLRAFVLFAASILYAALLSPYGACVLLWTGVITYAAGLWIGLERKKGKKQGAADRITAGCAILYLCSLFLFKYAQGLSSFFPASDFFINLVMPLGYSYYLFSALGYLFDVRGGKQEAIKNPLDFLLFLSWFPKFISGPIERTENLLPQIKELQNVRFLDGRRWKEAFLYILWGGFLKICIADRLCDVADTIFTAYPNFTGAWKILGSLFYTIQIYTDFAGYSYIALGISLLFGIRLTVNFEVPYAATNISSFWRRWHISLSSWFRDYLYIPLGGNQKGSARKVFNVFIVFIACGLWHGENATFLVWGLLHALYNAFDLLAAKKGWTKIRSGMPGRILTFLAVSFAWIFFKSESLTGAAGFILGMFSVGSLERFIEQASWLEINASFAWCIGIFTVALIFTDLLSYYKKKDLVTLVGGLHPALICVIVYFIVVVIMVFGAYGSSAASSGYLYMEF